MTDNYRKSTTRRSMALEAQHVEALRETVDRLRDEVAELRASRERLVLAAAGERRAIERDLHDGLQQQLVALATNLQLARRSADDDLAAAKALLDEMTRDVRQALDETGRLAQRIYPPLLEAGGLLTALRAAAVSLGLPTRFDVTARAGYPSEVAGTVYFSCVAALEGARTGATVTVRDEDGALAFDVVVDQPPSGLDLLRDRVEALGGSLTIGSEPGGGTYVAGSLPLSR
jgi:signal transduction histidine kinase